MDFVFVCPETQKVFKTDDFSITENDGVKTDPILGKFLDAQVMINGPCPYCGRQHRFHASELSCPFGPGETSERDFQDGDSQKHSAD